jgi:AcrR family transcriptional regulator
VPKLAEDTRAARRDQIIAAALTCFARTGYHGTTMADIAVQAGVSKGTPYLYFPGKEALFIALHEEWDCGFAVRVDAAVGGLPAAAQGSPMRVLGAVAAAFGAHVAEHPTACRALLEARTLAVYHPAIMAIVRAADARFHEQLARLITAGIAAGEWPAGTDPALQARLFIACLYGLAAQWQMAPASFSWDAITTALAGIVTQGRVSGSAAPAVPASR